MKAISLPSRSLIGAAASVLLLALIIGACSRVPYTGRRSVVLLDFPSEVELGAAAYKEILAEEKIIPEGREAKAVRVVGRRISQHTPAAWRKLDWEFQLIKSDSVNAFCLPGGKVAVYQGILPAMGTEAGLAAVLGHEAGHAVARHGAERISGQMLLSLGLAVADVSLSNSEHHDGIMAMLGLGASLGVVLPFSRANELESDYLGGIFMAKAGYDPRESVAVWERMSTMYGDQPVAIFSTHPTNRKRIERLGEEMPTFMRHYRRSKKQYGKGITLK
ncbi:MAG: M48 family metallopeptidase [Proteobacteria bacterium]|nr:M48 family metallopeptidase [Pseudomonadota bacterium]